jgi:hypothetical protein
MDGQTLFFFFSEFVFRAHVTTDKEAVTPIDVLCMTGGSTLARWGGVYVWGLVDGVEGIARIEADINRATSKVCVVHVYTKGLHPGSQSSLQGFAQA